MEKSQKVLSFEHKRALRFVDNHIIILCCTVIQQFSDCIIHKFNISADTVDETNGLMQFGQIKVPSAAHHHFL